MLSAFDMVEQSPVLKAISVFLGLFFIFVGLTKITPKVNQELHLELKRDFVRYSKVIPFIKTYNVKIPSKYLRQFVGGLEVSCGTALAFVPFRCMKQTANSLLLMLMLYTMYTHHAISDRFERLAPSLVFLFLLICRLVIDYQVQRKSRSAADAGSTADSPNTATLSKTDKVE